MVSYSLRSSCAGDESPPAPGPYQNSSLPFTRHWLIILMTGVSGLVMIGKPPLNLLPHERCRENVAQSQATQEQETTPWKARKRLGNGD